jgi:ribosomal protein S1/tetratricopeptide (TPR) repeat protein
LLQKRLVVSLFNWRYHRWSDRCKLIAAMVGKQIEGDLFPRGKSEGSVARVRKRDGTVLFGGDAPACKTGPLCKRPRTSGSPNTAAQDSVAALGISAKRLSIGMTLLGIVTSSSDKAVEISLPGGCRAHADPSESLVEESLQNLSRGKSLFPPTGSLRRDERGNHNEDDEDMLSNSSGLDSESEADEDSSIAWPLHRVVSAGDVVRVAVVSTEKKPNGGWKIVVSCRPSLINVDVGIVGGSISTSKSATTLRQGELMWGAIKAREDHGYVVDFGASVPTLGFLNFSDCCEAHKLHPGWPVEVVILEPQRDGRKIRQVVKVSHMPAAVNTADSYYSPEMAFSALRAGIRVRARVSKVESGGGIELKLFGIFSVVVERTHVPHIGIPAVDASVDARIIYVDAGTKRIGASLLPCMVRDRRPRTVPSEWTIGHILPATVVARVDPGFGIVLRVAHSADKVDEAGNCSTELADIPLFAHASRVSDERVDKLESVYHTGMCMPTGARIVSFAPLDGVVNVDLRPSILSRKALSAAEIIPGEKYRCKIVSHSSTGTVIASVDGDDSIRGIIPASHVSDTAVASKRLAQDPRFRVGAYLMCICLTVDEGRGKIILTSKRSIVNSDRPILASFEQAQAAVAAASANRDDSCVFDGCVARVTEALSVLISFTGGVQGMVSKNDLCLDTVADPSSDDLRMEVDSDDDEARLAAVKQARKAKKAKRMLQLSKVDRSKARTQAQIENLFPVGRTVRIRVLRADPTSKRMSLSFDLKKRVSESSAPTCLLPVGSFVSGYIASVDETARTLIVSAHGKDIDKVTECLLPFDHLSDFSEMTKRIATEYVKSTVPGSSPFPLEKALVLGVSPGPGGQPLLTLKPSLMVAQEAGTLPSTLTDIRALFAADAASQSRTILRGFVKAALPSGAIIGFGANLVGFARKSRISDEFVADPSNALVTNQSVSVVVESVDAAQGRFTVSMRRSDVGMEPVIADTTRYFEQFGVIRETFGRPPVEIQFPIGAVVDSILDASRPYGMVLHLESFTGAKAFGVVLEQNVQQHKDLVADVVSDFEATRVTPTCLEPGHAESESIASAAAATAEAYAMSLSGTPLAKYSGSATRRPMSTSSRKTRHQRAAEEKAAVSAMPARVLDVDPFSGVVDVSLEPDVVESAGKRSPMTSGRKIGATVLLVKDEYIILSLPRGKGKTAIGYCLMPAVELQLRMQLRRGIVLPCVTIASTRPSPRSLVSVDWALAALALTSKKSANLARVISRKEAAPDVTSKSIKVADKVFGKVTASFPMQANVAVAPGVVGRIHVTRYWSIKKLAKHDLGRIGGKAAAELALPTVDEKVRNLTVVSVRDPRKDDGGKSKIVTVELTSGRDLATLLADEDASKYDVGSIRLGFIKHVKKDETSGRTSVIWIALTPSLAGHCSRIDALGVDGVDLPCLNVGIPISCMMTSKAAIGDTRVNVSASSNGMGDGPFYGIVSSVRAGDGLRVELPWHARVKDAKNKWWGVVGLCDISDDFDDAVKLMRTTKAGDVVRVCTVNSADKDTVQLTMRASLIGEDNTNPVVDELIVESVRKEAVGSTVRGFVRSVAKSGGFVSIGRHLIARVLLSDLSDEFVEKPSKTFPVGMLVSGKILSVDAKNPAKVQLVMRKRERKPLKTNDKESTTLSLTEGSIVKGTVTRVERFGALVKVAGGISALLHKSEADQDRIVIDPFAEWTVGQALTAVMLEPKDAGKHRVGTKRCYFEAAGLDVDSVGNVLEANADKKSSFIDVDVVGAQSIVIEHDSESEVSGDSDENVRSDADMVDSTDKIDSVDKDSSDSDFDQNADSTATETLPVARGFVFDDVPVPDAVGDCVGEDSTSDGEKATDQKDKSTKKSSREKREKKRAKENAEREIRAREEALANNPDTPETADDFERLLMGAPNASHIWIRYMAFRMSLSQFEKARELAERALETVALREELERVNIWVAYINLEASFGTSENASEEDAAQLRARAAAVFRVFDRACQRVTDVQDFHLQVAAALRLSQPEIANEVLRRSLKAFHDSKEVWIAMGTSQFASGKLDAGRQTVEKCLLSLHKTKHVAVIMKFAQLEYKHGSSERGRTVFESLIGNFPKRLDLWSVFLDMEMQRYRTAAKGSEEDQEERNFAIASVRRLFERSISLELSTKKTKFLFKRWLAFEIETGDKTAAASVRAKARTYVETKLVPAPSS